MKKTSKTFILLGTLSIFFLWGCKEDTPIAIQKEPVSTYPFDTARYETKLPYITLEDRGLEAFLVIDGLDKDNQVNGKISVEDATKIEVLQLSTFSDSLRMQKYRYFSNRYKVQDPTNLESYLYGFRLPKIPIRQTSDFNKFTNLSNLYVDCFENISIIDLSSISKLSSLAIIYPNSLQIIGKDSLNIFVFNNSKAYEKDTENTNSLLDISAIDHISALSLFNLSKVGIPKKGFENLELINSIDTSEKLEEIIKNFYGHRLSLANVQSLKELTFSTIPNNLEVSIEDCANLNTINFEKVNLLGAIRISNCSNLKSIDLSKFTSIYTCGSTNNSKLDTIYLNKNQSMESTCFMCGFRKDTWTTYVFK